jgi:hypothetical protein
MGYIQGEGRNQGTLFPVVLDDFVPANHMCRMIDAFVETLVMSELGFDPRIPSAAADSTLGYSLSSLREEPFCEAKYGSSRSEKLPGMPCVSSKNLYG